MATHDKAYKLSSEKSLKQQQHTQAAATTDNPRRGKSLISKLPPYFKCPVLNKRTYKTHKETREYVPNTGKRPINTNCP